MRWLLVALFLSGCNCGGSDPGIDDAVATAVADGGAVCDDPVARKKLEQYEAFIKPAVTDYDGSQYPCYSTAYEDFENYVIYEYSCAADGRNYRLCGCKDGCRLSCYNPRGIDGGCDYGFWVLK